MFGWARLDGGEVVYLRTNLALMDRWVALVRLFANIRLLEFLDVEVVNLLNLINVNIRV